MSLPINIEELLHGNTLEWERLEFKQGWNPEDVLHSMCAFANDLHNWGGGYIIIGIAEADGQIILPPVGLRQNQIDAFQKKIIELGNKISPTYFPIIEPYVFQGKHILVLWCPAGDIRPYTARTSLSKDAGRQSYIRLGSQSIIAKGENLKRLQELTARIPFDDRVNYQASIDDFDLGLIQAYLQEVKSGLYSESIHMTLKDLCKAMRIAKGPEEDMRPINVGLLFFTKEPHRYFSRAWIEVVWHKDDSGSNFKEYYFKGPLHKQVRDALSFLKTNIIGEQVIKQSWKAEADRFYNFPYKALEEIIANSVYHKSYEIGSPIEIQIFPDKLITLSHPGPLPPVNIQLLTSQRSVFAREYRNRRIGDFLKELHLTEGRGTGLPAIHKAMGNNGSPKPVFESDDETYVLVTLPVHDQFKVITQVNDLDESADKVYIFNDLEDVLSYTHASTNLVTNPVTNLVRNQVKNIITGMVHGRVKEALSVVNSWRSKVEIFEKLGITNQKFNRVKYLEPLIRYGWVALEFPDNKTNPRQRYKITESGKKLMELIAGDKM